MKRGTQWRTLSMLGILTVVGGVEAAGQERPTLAVAVDLVADRFENAFDGAEIKEIEEQAAARIAVTLQERLRFLVISDGTSAGYGITLELDDPPQASPLGELDAYLRMHDPDGESRRILWHPFRKGIDALRSLGSPTEMVAEVDAKVATADFEMLVDSLLSRIPITNEGATWEDPLGWVIPFAMEDLCIDQGSSLLVQTVVLTGAGPQAMPYRAKVLGVFQPTAFPAHLERFRRGIFSQVDVDQDNVALLLDAAAQGGAELQAVFVIAYRPREADCESMARPEDQDFRVGGNR